MCQTSASPGPRLGGMATRSRANPGGNSNVLDILGPDVLPLRARKPPWFKVPAPGSPRYRRLKSLIETENLHTVCQEAACPNIGECWQRGHRHVHDPRRHLHPPLRLLQRQDRQADVERPARARPRRAVGGQDGPQARGDHERRPRRSPRLRSARVRRRHPPDQTAGAELQSRSLDPRLPRRGDAARQGDRRTTRRVQPQRRGRPPPVPGGAAGFNLRPVVPRPQERQGDRRRRHHDQVRPHGRPRRKLRRDGRHARDAPRQPRPGPDRGAVPTAHRKPSPDRPVLAPRRVQGARAGRVRARVRARRRRAARAEQLPRRPARAPARAGHRPACGGGDDDAGSGS